MNSRLSILSLIAVFLVQSVALLSQVDTLQNGNYLIFPNWKVGDRKRLKSRTLETIITKGDTTYVEYYSTNIITVKEKTDKHYIINIKDLDFDYREINEYWKNADDEADDSIDIENILQRVLKNTFQKLLSSGSIDYKVDKWGYYNGLVETIELDGFKEVFKKEILATDKFSSTEIFEINEVIESIQIEELEEIISQTFYEEIRSLHTPYDLELPKNSIMIDTVKYLIPWFSDPVFCAQSVSSSLDDEEVNITISYDYLIHEQDYLNLTAPETLEHFNLKLTIQYTLDYVSKWIKKMDSTTVRTENDTIYVEKHEGTIESIR